MASSRMTQGQLALHVQQTHHTAIMVFAVPPPLILAIPMVSMIPQVRMCKYAITMRIYTSADSASS